MATTIASTSRSRAFIGIRKADRKVQYNAFV
jgi:hypothetical protein